MATMQTIADYGLPMRITPGQAQSPVAGYMVPAEAPGPIQAINPSAAASNAAAGAGTSPNAPTVSWLAVLAVLVLIRVAYERGAKLE